MENTNPLMQKLKIPGRIVQLPSMGALYNGGELDNESGEVHVFPMSAMAEITLKNPDMLFNGSALDVVFRECIPAIKKPQELFGRDIDALMFYLRLVTYGPSYEIRVTHDCKGAKEHGHIVDLEAMIAEMDMLDPTQLGDFAVTLPNGQVVSVQPARFSHMVKLFQMNSGKETFTDDDMKENIAFNLTNLISDVDGLTDKVQIGEWVRAITTPYQNRIAEAIENTMKWGPKNTVTCKCRDCGTDFEVELPLNPISFFTE